MSGHSEHADLQKQVDELKSALDALYMPKHLEMIQKKVGTIEHNTRSARDSMTVCYSVTFCTVFMFMILCVGMMYMMYKMNYFKFMLRQNVFGRHVKPRTCYACYRPWRNKRFQRQELAKECFSAPECEPLGPEQVPMTSTMAQIDECSSD